MSTAKGPPNPGKLLRLTARDAHARGFSIVPPKEDGSKAPIGEWKRYQAAPAAAETVDQWYGREGTATGLGIVCGAVSGGLEVLDFDDRDAYIRFKQRAIEIGLGALVERIEAAYLEESPSTGIHWAYYTDEVRGNTKLAERPGTPTAGGKPTRKALIETRGEGGFIVCAPSYGQVHPSGEPYRVLSGSLATITTLTGEERDALWDLARSFDEMPLDKAAAARSSQWEVSACNGVAPRTSERPGDAFNARVAWDEILGAAGWTKVFTSGEETYWRRPGKSIGHSATTNYKGTNLFKVFTSSSEFAPERTYSKLGVYTALNHGGDFKAATKALAAQGYGDPARKPAATNGTAQADEREEPEQPGFAGMSDEDLGIVPLSSVKPKATEWLWKYRLECGSLALMAGEGGLGKSQILLAIAAAITTEGVWPDHSGIAPIGDVVIVAAEDSPEKTILPRLMALGADISQVTIIKAKYVIRKNGKDPVIHMASFQDRDYWREVFRRRPNCRLFIADPLPSYLGRGVNDSKNTEIRAVLEPFLDEIIVPAGICMLGNTHLNKTSDAKQAIHRISGSTAYVNLPRNVHIVVRDPENPERRFFKQAKCNSAPDNLPGLAFKIEKREIESDGGEIIETAVPVFETELVATVDLNEAVNGSKKKPGPEPEKTQELAEWIYDFLSARACLTYLAAVGDEAGAAGHLGTKNERGYWTNWNALRRAAALIPNLPAPRGGQRINEVKTKNLRTGKEAAQWSLVSAESPF